MGQLSFEFLKSKRFVSAVAYVLALVIVAAWPIFDGMELDITTGLTLVFGLLIGGYALEDVMQVIVIARAMAAKTQTPIDDQLINAIAAFLEKGIADKGTIPDPQAYMAALRAVADLESARG